MPPDTAALKALYMRWRAEGDRLTASMHDSGKWYSAMTPTEKQQFNDAGTASTVYYTCANELLSALAGA